MENVPKPLRFKVGILNQIYELIKNESKLDDIAAYKKTYIMPVRTRKPQLSDYTLRTEPRRRGGGADEPDLIISRGKSSRKRNKRDRRAPLNNGAANCTYVNTVDRNQPASNLLCFMLMHAV